MVFLLIYLIRFLRCSDQILVPSSFFFSFLSRGFSLGRGFIQHICNKRHGFVRAPALSPLIPEGGFNIWGYDYYSGFAFLGGDSGLCVCVMG